jgi:ABC transport system ATP-binding/permease protein
VISGSVVEAAPSVSGGWSDRRAEVPRRTAGLVARDVEVRLRSGKTLLQGVSFRAGGGSLVAVAGGSGTGKSTLLSVLGGLRAATSGHVQVAGHTVGTGRGPVRRAVGFVPQRDALHDDLTVEEELRYTGRLRLGRHLDATDLNRRMQDVLGRLDLRREAHTLIRHISGGQRKRTAIGIELLSAPPVILLDEPTSALDIDLREEVTTALRNLADAGHTVIFASHHLDEIEAADHLLLLGQRGRCLYYGPPAGAPVAIGALDLRGMFRAANALGPTERPDLDRPAEVTEPRERPLPLPPDGCQTVCPQIAILAGRYARTMRSDRSFVRLSTIMPLVLALLGRAVPDPQGLISAGPSQPGGRYLLTVLVFGAAFIGAINAVREIVKERDLFARELLSGQSPLAYLLSKFVVLSALTTVQVAAFAFFSLLGRPTPPTALILGSSEVEILAAVALACVVSVAVGLAISALTRSSDNAMIALLSYVMVQLVLCGGLVPLAGRAVVSQLSWLCPARLTFAMAAATANFARSEPASVHPDLLWRHSAGIWMGDALVAGLLGLVALAIAWNRLCTSARSGRAPAVHRPFAFKLASRRGKTRRALPEKTCSFSPAGRSSAST